MTLFLDRIKYLMVREYKKHPPASSSLYKITYLFVSWLDSRNKLYIDNSSCLVSVHFIAARKYKEADMTPKHYHHLYILQSHVHCFRVLLLSAQKMQSENQRLPAFKELCSDNKLSNDEAADSREQVPL